MKKRTRELIETVERHHDWSDGDTTGGHGTELFSTDVCRCCGLQRHWYSDRLNGVEGQYRFETFAGRELPLIEAAQIKCCEE